MYALHLWVLCVGTILFAYCMIISKTNSKEIFGLLVTREWNICMISFYSLIEGCEHKTLLILFQILIWLQIELSDSFHYFANNLSVCRLSRAALLAIQKCIFFDSFISKWSDKAVRILRNLHHNLVFQTCYLIIFYLEKHWLNGMYANTNTTDIVTVNINANVF